MRRASGAAAAGAVATVACPCDEVARNLERLQNGEAQLYVLQRGGPTSYLVKEDGDDAKFKVLLGTPNMCSCAASSRAGAACIHLLFVMTKVLRVPVDNPLAWQASLAEREINEVLSFRPTSTHADAGSKAKASAVANAGSKKRTFLKKRSGERRLESLARNKTSFLDLMDEELDDDDTSSQREVSQKPIEEGEVCPICQEDLPTVPEDHNSQAKHAKHNLTYCRFGCGNSVHIKCMKVWADHRSSVGEEVSCPLCRVHWGTLELAELRRQDLSRRAAASRPRTTHYGVRCQGCQASPIVGDRYRCLMCRKGVNLCRRCYNHRESFRCFRQSHPFLVKSFVGEDWRSADPRPRVHTNDAAPEWAMDLQSRELTAQDYDALLALDDPFRRANEVQAPTLHELIVKHMKSTSFAASSDCRVCERPLSAQPNWKELPCCQEATHAACALELAAKTECSLCQAAFFPGLAKPNKRNARAQDDEVTKTKDVIQLPMSSTFGLALDSALSVTRCGSVLPSANPEPSVFARAAQTTLVPRGSASAIRERTPRIEQSMATRSKSSSRHFQHNGKTSFPVQARSRPGKIVNLTRRPGNLRPRPLQHRNDSFRETSGYGSHRGGGGSSSSNNNNNDNDNNNNNNNQGETRDHEIGDVLDLAIQGLSR